MRSNREHYAPETQGIIPANQYEMFFAEFKEGIRNSPDENHQQVLSGTQQKFAQFNQDHHLPAEWNIGSATLNTVQQMILAQGNDEEVKSESDVVLGDVPQHNNPPPAQTVGVIAGLDDFDTLESAARETLFSHSQSKVLFWWKRGTGTQVFVQYGSDEHPIFRIRAGSYEPYDPKETPQILSVQRGRGRSDFTDNVRFPLAAQPRGHVKRVEEDNDGEFYESWMYQRLDVAGILGIGWKVEDDDEENEGLDQLWPEKDEGDKFPFTRVLVAWKDGKVTLEDRAFMRRIKRGPTKLADMVIYHKALSSEILYRQEQGLPCKHLLEDLEALSNRHREGESEDPTSQRQTLAPAGGATPTPSLVVPEQQGTPAPIGRATPGSPFVVPALQVTPAPSPVPEHQGTPAAVGEASPVPVGSTPVPTLRGGLLASMVRGRAPQGSQQVRTSTPATTPAEDPRDAQIRELQSQLAELRMTVNQQQQQPRYNLRSQAQTPIPSWNQVYRYQSEVSDTPQPPRGPRSRGRKARAQPPAPGWFQPGAYAESPQAYYGHPGAASPQAYYGYY
jgi:hypothetical protein